jgi:hypothetical protein
MRTHALLSDGWRSSGAYPKARTGEARNALQSSTRGGVIVASNRSYGGLWLGSGDRWSVSASSSSAAAGAPLEELRQAEDAHAHSV